MFQITTHQFSSVQSLSHVQIFATPRTAAHQASLSITNSRSSLRLMSVEWVMPTNHLIPFSHLQSFPASGSFPMSQFFASGGQSIGVSASTSVLPMNIQDWYPLGWTGWISLQFKGLSRVYSNTTVQNHQFFATQLQENANENHNKLSPDSCWRGFAGDSRQYGTCSQCERPKFNPWVGKNPAEGNGYPLQYSCLEKSMNRGAWWATVHGIAESDTTEQLTSYSCWTALSKRQKIKKEKKGKFHKMWRKGNTVAKNVNWYSYCGKCYAISFKKYN